MLTATPVGAVFQLDSTGFKQISPPAMTSLGTHGSVVAWGEDSDDPQVNPSTHQVFFTIINAQGNPLSLPTLVDEPGSHAALGVDVAGNVNGNFVVTWLDIDAHETKFRLFNSTGQPQGGIGVVATEQSAPQAAMTADGSFILLWQDGVFTHYRLFDATGAQIGATGHTLNEPAPAGKTFQYFSPAVDADENGNYDVVYRRLTLDNQLNEFGSDVIVHRISSTGTQGPAIVVTHLDPESELLTLDIAAAPGGSFAVMTDDVDLSDPTNPEDFQVRYYSNAGAFLSKKTIFSQTGFAPRIGIAGDVANSSQGVFTWSLAQGGASSGIEAQSFGPLGIADGAVAPVDGGIQDSFPRFVFTNNLSGMEAWRQGLNDPNHVLDGHILVRLVNDVPPPAPLVITSLSTLAGAAPAQTQFAITYDALAAAVTSTGGTGNPLQFMVSALGAGTLTRNGQPVQVGDVLAVGDQFLWTVPQPTNNQNGLLSPFSVKISDGATTTTFSFPVRLLVQAKPVVSILATDAQAAETTAPAPPNLGKIVVSRLFATADPLTVILVDAGSTVSGSDAAITDEQGSPIVNGVVTIPANRASVTLTVTPNDDAIGEPTETLHLAIMQNAASYLVNPLRGDATVAIADNEPRVIIAVSDPMAVEVSGNGAPNVAKFTVTRLGASNIDLHIPITIGGTADPSRYSLNMITNGELVIPASNAVSAGVQIILSVNDDVNAEPDQTVTLTVHTDDPVAPHYSVENATAEATIKDNEAVVSITRGDATATEGATPADTATFTVMRDNGGPGLGVPLNVPFTTPGNANPARYRLFQKDGNALTPISDSVTIPAGKASTMIVVQPVDDLTDNGTQTLTIALAQDTAASGHPSFNIKPDKASASVTLKDNDQLPTVKIDVQDTTATEEIGVPPAVAMDTAVVRVTRFGSTVGPLTVKLSHTGTATFNTDYVVDGTNGAGTTVTIPDGQDHIDVIISAKDDLIAENDETATFTLLASPAQYNLAPADIGATAGSVTIVDNEPVVSVQLLDGDGTATELSTDNAQYVFIRHGGDMSKPLIVNYTVTGTATNAIDYVNLGTSIVFPAGEGVVMLPLSALGDTLSTPSEVAGETAIVTLKAAGVNPTYKVNAGGKSATVTIQNTVPPVGGPGVVDFVTLGASVPSRSISLAHPGGPFTVSATIRNQGAAANIPNFPIDVAFYLSTDNVFSLNDLKIGTKSIPSLAAKTATTVSLSINPATLIQALGLNANNIGSYYLIVRADDTNNYAEIDSNNNLYATNLSPVTITA